MALKRDPVAFPKLNDAQIAALSTCAKLKQFAPRQALFSAGQCDYAFYVIKSGQVEIVDHSSGQDEVVTVHEPGEFTGDVDMLTGRPALVSAIARTATEAYEVAAADLRRIINEMPQIGDVLLRAFLMRRRLLEDSGFAAVRVVGSRYSRDTHRIREFLARNKVPFTWIDLENDPSVNALLGRFGIRPEETPVVVRGSDVILRNPSNPQLADALGIRKPLEQTLYDLAIVGAGPAGLAAAVYGASEGLKTVVLDRIGPGGQAGTSSKIENYLGFPTGLSGSDLASRALIQAEKFGATLSSPAEVAGLDSQSGYHVLRMADGGELSAKCVVVSAGAAYRKLDAEGCARFEGSGIYYAATPIEAQLCRNAQVVIVGGGNSAGQAAVFLAERASKVLLVIRSDDLSKSMSHYLIRRIEQTPKIEVRRRTEITKAQGDQSLSAVQLRSTDTGKTETITCVALFVFIGAVPHTSWLKDAVELDRNGFVKTGLQLADAPGWTLRRQPFLLETSRPGVFAAGDVRLGSTKRVASAVGEGAMAVQFAHQYLSSS